MISTDLTVDIMKHGVEQQTELLGKVKKARKEIEDHKYDEGEGFGEYSDGFIHGIYKSISILDKLIEDEEGCNTICPPADASEHKDNLDIVKSIPLDKVKQAREEIADRYDPERSWSLEEKTIAKTEMIDKILEILDKLIAEEEQ